MMKKYFMLLLAFLLVAAIEAVAQERIIRAFEGEISLGVHTPINGLGDNVICNATLIQLEGRYNFVSLPMDVGVLIRGAKLMRERENPQETWPGWYEDKKYDITTWHTMAVADYNFRREKKASFFVGLAAGCGSENAWNEKPVNPKFCFMPRCGVELWHHLRITLSYTHMDKRTNHIGVSLGGVFGGGKKKAK